jgi:hypothetical protein
MLEGVSNATMYDTAVRMRNVVIAQRYTVQSIRSTALGRKAQGVLKQMDEITQISVSVA